LYCNSTFLPAPQKLQPNVSYCSNFLRLTSPSHAQQSPSNPVTTREEAQLPNPYLAPNSPPSASRLLPSDCSSTAPAYKSRLSCGSLLLASSIDSNSSFNEVSCLRRSQSSKSAPNVFQSPHPASRRSHPKRNGV
jgi:hypothetical protein